MGRKILVRLVGLNKFKQPMWRSLNRWIFPSPFAAPPNSDAGFLRCLCFVEDQIQMKPNHV